MAARLLCIAIACMIVLGCSDEETKKIVEPDSHYVSPSTITNVLQNLKTSYEELSYGEYVKLLSDEFLYEFDPSDVAGEEYIPNTGVWGVADERLSAHNMFSAANNMDGYRAESITLDFNVGAPAPSDKNAAWTKVTLSNVNLRVDSVHAQAGTLTYLVRGDQAVLHFVQTDQQEWKIAYWEDKPIGLVAPVTETTTWGQIKGLWH